ncbi:MAG: DUF5671 domain-containing protein [Gammaproteobacteria bacterium]|jgi:hypothetical protein
MADTRLRDFIDSALRSGKTREEIGAALTSAGWSDEQISDGMRFFANVPFDVPVPRPRAQLSARDAFVYLLMFGTLYVSAFQFGNLLFDFINLALPEGLAEFAVQRIGNSIRWATSSLIVAFPVFVWLHLKIQREVVADPTRGQSAMRRWLTHLTLLIAAGVIVGDSITLVYNLLSGEMTLPFVLKVLVVAAISGSGFAYFLNLVRQDSERSQA